MTVQIGTEHKEVAVITHKADAELGKFFFNSLSVTPMMVYTGT